MRPRPALDTPVVAPRDATEASVARIWEDVLNVAPVGVDDDFFDLGGESLHAFAVIARVGETLGVTLTVRDLFGAGTIAGMAARIRELADAR